jgi:hypothetical protein
MDTKQVLEFFLNELRPGRKAGKADFLTDREEMLKKMRAWGEKLDEETRATLAEIEPSKQGRPPCEKRD